MVYVRLFHLLAKPPEKKNSAVHCWPVGVYVGLPCTSLNVFHRQIPRTVENSSTNSRTFVWFPYADRYLSSSLIIHRYYPAVSDRVRLSKDGNILLRVAWTSRPTSGFNGRMLNPADAALLQAPPRLRCGRRRALSSFRRRLAGPRPTPSPSPLLSPPCNVLVFVFPPLCCCCCCWRRRWRAARSPDLVKAAHTSYFRIRTCRLRNCLCRYRVSWTISFIYNFFSPSYMVAQDKWIEVIANQ